MKKYVSILIPITFVLSYHTYGQWQLNGNTVGSAYIGTNNAASFRIFTEGVHLASFTYGNSITAPVVGTVGDGLRIFDATNPLTGPGILDLYTTTGNRTHVQFAFNGSINGTGSASGTRMDYLANGAGFWFNATSGRAIWNVGGIENARMGTNGYWHFGPSAVDAARRVEIQDNAQQLRLSRATGPGLTEFYVRQMVDFLSCQVEGIPVLLTLATLATIQLNALM